MQNQQINQEQIISTKYGIVGFVLAIIGFFIPILIFSILAIIFSSIQLKRNKTGLAVAGLVIGIIGVLISFVVVPVILVTIIWAAMIPQIQDSLNEGTICLDVTSQVQLSFDQRHCINEENQLVFGLRRGPTEFDLEDIRLLVSSQGSTNKYNFIEDNSQIYETSGELVRNKNQLPKQDEEKIYYIAGVSNADQIALAPIVLTKNGKKDCDISSTRTVRIC